MSEADLVPPTRGSGPAWTSPTDGSDRGWPDGRYVVAFTLADGATEEDCRKETLPEARTRRYLLHQELARMGHRGFSVVVWDAEDPEHGDLVQAEVDEGVGGTKKGPGRPSQTLTDEQRGEIRRRHAEGETVTELARAFGVSYGAANYAAKPKRGGRC